VLAAIDAAGDADVVVIGHVGFPTGFRELWDCLPRRQVVQLRFWAVPTADLPREREARIDWLFDAWQTLDRWIDARHTAAAAEDEHLVRPA
jgi:hypothetical protein